MRKEINIKLTLLQSKELNNLLIATYEAIAKKSIKKRFKTVKDTRLLAAIKEFCRQSVLSENEITGIELALKANDNSFKPENKH